MLRKGGGVITGSLEIKDVNVYTLEGIGNMTKKHSAKWFSRKASKLQNARDLRDKLKGELEAEEEIFQKRNRKLIKRIEKAQSRVESRDKILREQVLAAFTKYDNRAPGPGITVKDTRHFEVVDYKLVFDWCIKHKLFLDVALTRVRRFCLEFPDVLIEGTSVRAHQPRVDLSRNFHRQLSKEK